MKETTTTLESDIMVPPSTTTDDEMKIKTMDTTTTTTTTIKTNQEKEMEEFRVYSEDKTQARVINHYRDMRKYQTVDFYNKMEHKYTFENGQYRKLMTIEQAFEELEHYVVSIKYYMYTPAPAFSLSLPVCSKRYGFCFGLSPFFLI